MKSSGVFIYQAQVGPAAGGKVGQWLSYHLLPYRHFAPTVTPETNPAVLRLHGRLATNRGCVDFRVSRNVITVRADQSLYFGGGWRSSGEKVAQEPPR